MRRCCCISNDDAAPNKPLVISTLSFATPSSSCSSPPLLNYALKMTASGTEIEKIVTAGAGEACYGPLTSGFPVQLAH